MLRHGRRIPSPFAAATARELCCPAHQEQRIEGNGRKYFLHLLISEQLKARGMADKKAKLVIQAYPVLVLRNLWATPA